MYFRSFNIMQYESVTETTYIVHLYYLKANFALLTSNGHEE